MGFEFDLSELTEFAEHLVNSDLEATFERIAKEIAKALLARMKSLTPVGKTYDLINGWNGNRFKVTEVENGYEVLIMNKDPKAVWVNDGHQAYNQYGGSYLIHDKVTKGAFGKTMGRVQVRKPYQWQEGDHNYYVFGHFFVERGILQLSDTNEIELIIMRELQKWWGSV